MLSTGHHCLDHSWRATKIHISYPHWQELSLLSTRIRLAGIDQFAAFEQELPLVALSTFSTDFRIKIVLHVSTWADISQIDSRAITLLKA